MREKFKFRKLYRIHPIVLSNYNSIYCRLNLISETLNAIKLEFLRKQRDNFEIFQTSTEARCLADQVELYYNNPSPSKLGLLEKFTRQPTLFSHEDLIAEMNSITLGETAVKN